MTDYRNYNPRKTALDAARDLLTKAACAAMDAGALPKTDLPDFIVEIPADTKTATWPPTLPWWAPVPSTRHRARSPRLWLPPSI